MAMSSMLSLGLFVFGLETLAYQSFQRSTNWKHPSNARVGRRAGRQYTGPGDDNITLAGVLYPELTGGKLSLAMVRQMAAEGKSWPLMQGTGDFIGLYIIESIDETNTLFFTDGSPRKIEFTLKLERTDDDAQESLGEFTPSLMAML